MKRMSIFFILFISLFYAVGIGILGFSLVSAKRSVAAANWPTAEGKVTHCSLNHSSSSDSDTYEVKVAYSYSVKGQPFTGDRLAFGYAGSSGQNAHQEIQTALQNAKTVDVRYDPENPAVSTLSFGIHRSIQFMFAFGVTWLAFVVGFTIIWWVASNSDNVLLRNLVVK